MADEEHVVLLRQGVEVWNKWREEHRDILPTLSGADLTGALLGGADLSGADLTNADLTGADLSSADLTGALLGGTDLTGADLGGANLSVAVLISAVLNGADLTGALLYETVLSNVNLINATGLEAVLHRGYSTVDHRTLQLSGSLPLKFLRGVGFSDNLIDYLPSLLNRPIQFYSCFISYSSKDQDFAERLHADLQNKGVRCWFAPHDMPIGAKIIDAIDEAIRLRDKVLLILSEHSVARDLVSFPGGEGVDGCVKLP